MPSFKDSFDRFIDQFAEAIASRIRIAKPAPANGRKKRVSPNKGKKFKRDMSCRVAGCKNKSKGPRFGYICELHLKKLSAKQLGEARERWRAAHA